MFTHMDAHMMLISFVIYVCVNIYNHIYITQTRMFRCISTATAEVPEAARPRLLQTLRAALQDVQHEAKALSC